MSAGMVIGSIAALAAIGCDETGDDHLRIGGRRKGAGRGCRVLRRVVLIVVTHHMSRYE
jgi:hypothetical protein